jgi:hypothetical protein
MAVIAISAIQLFECKPIVRLCGSLPSLERDSLPSDFSMQMATPAIWIVVRGIAVRNLRLGDGIQALALQGRK